MTMFLNSILAGSRARFVEKLLEGDVIAWSCLAGAIVLSVVVSIIKKKMSARQNPDSRG
jgi:uncharacterized membrane protein YvlD (DUF360 family)